MWFVFALGSAVFAALTSILAKIGIEGVNSTLATAIRTAVVLAMSWGMVFFDRHPGRREGHRPPQLAVPDLVRAGDGSVLAVLLLRFADRDASKVVPVDKLSVVITLALAFLILHEPVTSKNLIGCGLIAAGTLFMVL